MKEKIVNFLLNNKKAVIITITVILVITIILLMRKQIAVSIAKALHRVFRSRKETETSVHPWILRFWRSAGWDWVTPENITSYDNEQPWSAAFISYVYRRLYRLPGLGPVFPKSATHANYVVWARERRKEGKNTFIALKPSEYKPQPGDIVVKGRAGTNPNLDTLTKYVATHGDIVTANRGYEIEVVGGNVSNTITKRTFPATNGYISSPGHFAIVKV